MNSALRSNLLSLSDLLGVPDAVASLRALPWPLPVQRAARCSLDCLARRLPFVAEALEPVRKEQSTRRPVPAAEKPPQQSVAALAAVLRGPVVEAAAEAAAALGARRSARARAALLEALENRDGYFSPITRVATVQALARSLGAGEDGPLCEAARDVDPDVSLAAIEALTKRGGPGAIAALAEIAEDDSVFFLPATRRAATEGLAALRGRS